MALERDKHNAQHALLTLHESQLLDLYRRMTLIRRFEEKTAEMYSRGKITGFCHLYAGEEAVAVGAIYALYDKDYVVSTYREHGHCLAKGAEPRAVMAELFGKATGISHGRGGSMHLFDQDLRFMGGYAIVGGGLPIACGLALAVSYNEGPEVVCCFFGDGALPQGAFHETLNMASLWKLPLVFICENNFYGMGTLVQNAISQEELYRFRGHSMSDPAEYRSKREERIWQERDPIKNLHRRLLAEKRATDAKLDEVEREVAATIDDAVKFADESPEPSMDELGKGVYASENK